VSKPSLDWPANPEGMTGVWPLLVKNGIGAIVLDVYLVI
jgi:hypothetical protein